MKHPRVILNCGTCSLMTDLLDDACVRMLTLPEEQRARIVKGWVDDSAREILKWYGVESREEQGRGRI